MRNEKELYCIRIENIDWDRHSIFAPNSKTPNEIRGVPMSDRTIEVLSDGAACVVKAGYSPPSDRSRGT